MFRGGLGEGTYQSSLGSREVEESLLVRKAPQILVPRNGPLQRLIEP